MRVAVERFGGIDVEYRNGAATGRVSARCPIDQDGDIFEADFGLLLASGRRRELPCREQDGGREAESDQSGARGGGCL